MNKSELKQLIIETINDVRQEKNAQLLREYYRNDLKYYRLNEGILDSAKEKIVQPLISYLVKKLEKVDPARHAQLVNAVKDKDKHTLDKLFNNDTVKKEQDKISQAVVNEYATPISEAEGDKPSLLKSVWAWVKDHPVLTTVGILGAIAVIGLAIYGAGGAVPLLLKTGSGALGGTKSGAIGGGVVGAGKSAFTQLKDKGKIDLKQLGKDTLKGAGAGAAIGAVGGGLGAIGQAAASGAGMAVGDLRKYITHLKAGGSGEKWLAITAENPNVKDEMAKKYIEKWIQNSKDGKLTGQDLDMVAKFLKKYNENPEANEKYFEAAKNLLQDTLKDKASVSGLTKAIGDTAAKADAAVRSTSNIK